MNFQKQRFVVLMLCAISISLVVLSQTSKKEKEKENEKENKKEKENENEKGKGKGNIALYTLYPQTGYFKDDHNFLRLREGIMSYTPTDAGLINKMGAVYFFFKPANVVETELTILGTPNQKVTAIFEIETVTTETSTFTFSASGGPTTYVSKQAKNHFINVPVALDVNGTGIVYMNGTKAVDDFSPFILRSISVNQ